MIKLSEGNRCIVATFGGRLRRLREEKGLKQTELAKMLNLESSSTISQYENEELNRIPDAHVLKRLADILNCSVDYLLCRSNIRTPIETIAAHHDGDEFTEEELNEIEKFKEFVRMKREQDRRTSD